LEIEAFLPAPGAAGLEASRSTNDRLLIFVNERPVVMPEIAKVYILLSAFLLMKVLDTSIIALPIC